MWHSAELAALLPRPVIAKRVTQSVSQVCLICRRNSLLFITCELEKLKTSTYFFEYKSMLTFINYIIICTAHAQGRLTVFLCHT